MSSFVDISFNVFRIFGPYLCSLWRQMYSVSVPSTSISYLSSLESTWKRQIHECNWLKTQSSFCQNEHLVEGYVLKRVTSKNNIWKKMLFPFHKTKLTMLNEEKARKEKKQMLRILNTKHQDCSVWKNHNVGCWQRPHFFWSALASLQFYPFFGGGGSAFSAPFNCLQDWSQNVGPW